MAAYHLNSRYRWQPVINWLCSWVISAKKGCNLNLVVVSTINAITPSRINIRFTITPFILILLPPDAGTFWYHPHMNSVKQLGMGLVGLIIVEESIPVQFDEEHALMLKHWHIDKKGQWKVCW